jgi:hypothetical protein
VVWRYRNDKWQITRVISLHWYGASLSIR